MSANNTHIIERQVLELETNSQAHANRLQHEAENLIYREVLPVLSPLLDQIAGEHEVVEIDRLSLTLPPLTLSEFSQEFAKELISQLTKSLENIHNQSTFSASPKQTDIHSPNPVHVQSYTKERAIFRAALYFLQYGVLPAWYAWSDSMVLFTQLTTILEQHQSYQEELKELFIRFPLSVERLEKQWPAKEAQKILQSLHLPEFLLDSFEFYSQRPGKSLPELPHLLIQGAGGVILHPFLLPLYENLDLIQDEAFKDTEAQLRAIQIFQYLIWKQETMPEYECTLAKLLCGFPIHEPIDRFIELNEKEKKICEDLLQVIITYWEALKGASPEALQEGFLQREGKLVKKNTHWDLTVAPETVDVLLAKLPWGIGLIKMPWTDYMIHVHWE